MSTDGNVYMAGAYKDTDHKKFRSIPEGADHSMCHGHNPIPVRVPGLTNVRKIVSKIGYNVAILEDYSLRTWGK